MAVPSSCKQHQTSDCPKSTAPNQEFLWLCPTRSTSKSGAPSLGVSGVGSGGTWRILERTINYRDYKKEQKDLSNNINDCTSVGWNTTLSIRKSPCTKPAVSPKESSRGICCRNQSTSSNILGFLLDLPSPVDRRYCLAHRSTWSRSENLFTQQKNSYAWHWKLSSKDKGA